MGEQVIHHPAIRSSGAVYPGFAILKLVQKSWKVMGKRKALASVTVQPHLRKADDTVGGGEDPLGRTITAL